jgi:anti-sigma B factor antagonist
VQVGVSGASVWIRVAGRGSFQNSTGLKDFAAEMSRRGHKEFIIDLQHCELMDSTFMGTLAGIALRLGPDGTVKVIRANPRNRQVLGILGLDRVMTVEDAPPADPANPAVGRWVEPGEDGPREAKRETIIEAHESLAAVNPENAVRFKDVLEFLEQKKPEGQASP